MVLLPLLGMTNLLFFMKPHDEGPGMVAYSVINAILGPCQVSVIKMFVLSVLFFLIVFGLLFRVWF